MKQETQDKIDEATGGLSLYELAEVIEYLIQCYHDQKQYEKETNNKSEMYSHPLPD